MHSKSLLSLSVLVLFGAACSAGSDAGGSEASGTTSGGNTGGGDSSSSSAQGGAQASSGQFMGTSGTGTTDCFSNGTTDDFDMDGFTGDAGDCNDCDPNVNPNALEVMTDMGQGGGPAEPADEDCDGTIDNVPGPCDMGLGLANNSAGDAAKAMELCKAAADASDWGLVSSSWVRADGTVTSPNLQVGVMSSFGSAVLPKGGSNLVVISSGRARTVGQPNACGQCNCSEVGLGTAPSGYPQNGNGCDIGDKINDDIGLEVALKAPANATGYSFDFKFYTYEYPEFVCSLFNDQFMALANPAPPGANNGNISFDSANNPVSVNIAFFDVCSGCPAGAGELAGTGFDVWTGTFDDGEAGGTSWLRTTAPIDPNATVTLRLAVWDTQDTYLDSSAIMDNFQWIAEPGVTIGTTPVPM
jgi:hypothetical protein